MKAGLLLSGMAILTASASISAGEGTRPDPQVAAQPCAGAPRVVSATAPGYPEVSRRARVSGTVNVDVSIGESGAVTKTIVSPDSPAMLSPAAVAAANGWKFENAPGCSERKATLTFRFKLLPSGAERWTVFRPPFDVDIITDREIVDTYGTRN